MLKELTKVRNILIVYDGLVHLQLPTSSTGYLFEKLPPGSSYGLFSVLNFDKPPLGHSRFKIVSGLFSRLVLVPHKLLVSLREKFKELDQFIMAIAPEGTRSKNDNWRTS